MYLTNQLAPYFVDVHCIHTVLSIKLLYDLIFSFRDSHKVLYISLLHGVVIFLFHRHLSDIIACTLDVVLTCPVLHQTLKAQIKALPKFEEVLTSCNIYPTHLMGKLLLVH